MPSILRTTLAIVAAITVLAPTGAVAQEAAHAPPAAGSTAASASDTEAPASLNYVIGPGDRLRVTVWNQVNVSGEYAVSGDGSFTFPLIGRVVAGGLTLTGLEAELTRRLADGFYKNPQVTASVLEYRSKRVFVIGALRTPGTYSLTGNMSLIEALARAGSTAGDAADHALIIRTPAAQGPVLPAENASAEVTRIDLRRLNEGDPASNINLEDGDTVYVPRAETIYVYGEVRRPGSYPIPEGTTVRQALSLAGGPTEFGAINRVKILRTTNGEEQEIKTRLNDEVKAGDTVVVPERFF